MLLFASDVGQQCCRTCSVHTHFFCVYGSETTELNCTIELSVVQLSVHCCFIDSLDNCARVVAAACLYISVIV